MDVLTSLPTSSIDSVVTDPPYELGFMNKSWDNTGIAYQKSLWSELLRVLKPGGHLLAFGGSRTYHRMACAIEDGGLEIRDQIMWVYSSGFPKSLNISKAIDKKLDVTPEVVGTVKTNVGLKGGNFSAGSKCEEIDITIATSELAKQWDGYGTALKPAHEPICVARKPLEGTTLENVLKYGTGALNINGCRVDINLDVDSSQLRTMNRNKRELGEGWGMSTSKPDRPQVVRVDGRWPANLIHDGSDVVVALFPESNSPWIGSQNIGAKGGQMFGGNNRAVSEKPECRDAGSAARFFYCAKTSPKDRHEGLDHPGSQFSHGATLRAIENKAKKRGGNFHPTVKPTDLMRYLCRLVTPPGGIVLDPFMGSGSTGKAALLEGFGFIGCEKESEYFEIAKKRIAHVNPNELFARQSA
jgi:site-specific DNA-methyltransferase (adenine-specific)